MLLLLLHGIMPRNCGHRVSFSDPRVDPDTLLLSWSIASAGAGEARVHRLSRLPHRVLSRIRRNMALYALGGECYTSIASSSRVSSCICVCSSASYT